MRRGDKWYLVEMRVRTRNLIVGVLSGYAVAVATFLWGGPGWLYPLFIVGGGLVGYLLPEER